MPAGHRSQRVALDVGDQLGRRVVRPGVRVDELALAVEEDRRRERYAGLNARRDLQVRVAIARIRHGEALEELTSVAVVVLSVEAQERNLLAERDTGLLEGRELAAARRAPGRPLVHDDGIAAQVGELLLKVALLAPDQLIRLRVKRAELRRRAGKRLLHRRGGRRGALWLGFAAAGRENGDQED